MLIKILILFFMVLLLYQIIIAHFYTSKEGVDDTMTIQTPEYSSYNDNPSILANKNAANIENLKARMDSFDEIKQHVDDLSGAVDILNTQMDELQSQTVSNTDDLVNSMPDINATTDTTDTTEQP